MKHVATYARYSSDNQRDQSIEDQQRKCDQYAESLGITITRRYVDKAITGKLEDRPDYQRLKTDINNGEIELLIVDDLSRLSRSINAPSIVAEFKHMGTRLIAVADGIDSGSDNSNLLISVKAAMNNQFLHDIKKRVHRGLEGNAIKGRVTGGRIYGYKTKPHYSGTKTDVYDRPEVEYATLEIKEKEARWVRKIFEWAAEGRPYQWIAKELNRLGIPSQSGKGWAASTINTSSGGLPMGILNNNLYIGIKVWNKTETLHHPTTGKAKVTSRDKSEWIITDVPELRIVSDELWDAVKERQERQKKKTRKKQADTHANARTGRSSKYLFSGVLKCSECGANLVIVDKNHNYRCTNAHFKGEAVCTNMQKISRNQVEQYLLRSIKNDLFTERAVHEFRVEAEKAFKERKADLEPNIRRLTAELHGIEKDAEGLISFIQSNPNVGQNELIAGKLLKLEQAKHDAEVKLSKERSLIANVEPILPRALDRYREMVANLTDALQGHMEPFRNQVVGLLGEEVVVTPKPDGAWEATYRGSYRGLLRLGGAPGGKISDESLAAPFFDPGLAWDQLRMVPS